MPVLQYLDIGIGYAFAMLLMATLVGAAVQVIQAFLRTRAYQLENGLAAMIASLDPKNLSLEHALVLAKQVTNDTPVKGNWMAADIIQREEFIFILLRKAIAAGSDAHLWKSIQAVTGKDPQTLLLDIEKLLVEKEQAEPNAPSYLWRTKAIYEAGGSALAGRVFAWYDNTMRRVEDRVAYQGHWIATVLAFAVCTWINVDSMALLARLNRDDAFRTALVERAVEEVKKTPPNSPEAVSLKSAIQSFEDKANETRSLLPQALSDKPRYWPGILLSGVMVSLGTAFWWGLLTKLVGLKSSLAEKMEQQRQQREQTTA